METKSNHDSGSKTVTRVFGTLEGTSSQRDGHRFDDFQRYGRSILYGELQLPGGQGVPAAAKATSKVAAGRLDADQGIPGVPDASPRILAPLRVMRQKV